MKPRKCVECNRTKADHLFSYRKHICNSCYKKSPAYRKRRDSYLKRTYGISADEYDFLLRRQKGGCAICGSKSGGKHLAVDHDHKTGEVRGLLCKRHNSALARWVRNVEEAEATLDYYLTGAIVVSETLGRDVRVPEEKEKK
jgi:hypothetical protein